MNIDLDILLKKMTSPLVGSVKSKAIFMPILRGSFSLQLVHLLVRHGANPRQANLKGKTAFSLASVEIEPILRGNLAATYSSDSDSHSEEDSSDSILSTKEEDRTVDEGR